MATNPFDDVRLPAEVEEGALMGPRFSTTVTELTSGAEQRNAEWTQELFEADVGYGIMADQSGQPYEASVVELNFAEVMAFYRARRGRWRGFRFKDWTDYKATGEPIGIGDGDNQAFQLRKTYGEDTYAYIRKITRPVPGTVSVFVDGVGAAFALGALGVVTLTVAPDDGAVVTANFEFDIPVRFDTDVMQVQLASELGGAVPEIKVVGIRE